MGRGDLAAGENLGPLANRASLRHAKERSPNPVKVLCSLNDIAMTVQGVHALLKKWDESVPIEDKAAWRDPRVAESFIQALIDGDPTTHTRSPPTFRSPYGMLDESFYIGIGEKLVHANQIYCKVLIVRPGLDYFSRTGDVAELRRDLVNAEEVASWEPENTTHFVLPDRAERGRDATLDRIANFLR